MIRTDTLARLPKELAYRASDGLEVWLLWNPAADRLLVVVVDARTDDSFELDVTSEIAMDAFHHPYAYAATRGVHFVAGTRIPADALPV